MNDTVKAELTLLVVEKQELHKYLYLSPAFTQRVKVLDILSETDALDTLYKIALHQPDVLLIGSVKLDEDVLKLLNKVRERYPALNLALLLFSYRSGDADTVRKLASQGTGGLAVFLRQSLNELRQFVSILLAVKYGQRIFDPVLTGHLLCNNNRGNYFSQMTCREMETLGLVAEGYSNAAIAELMFIDEKTVERHLNSLYGKLRADSDFDKKHLRVAASRMYYETIGVS